MLVEQNQSVFQTSLPLPNEAREGCVEVRARVKQVGTNHGREARHDPRRTRIEGPVLAGSICPQTLRKREVSLGPGTEEELVAVVSSHDD
jgi:hypothetical protein